jgi:VanZ family protein
MAKPFTLLAVLWALVIYVGATAQVPPGPFTFFPQEDKLIHFLEFAIMAFLIYKAFIHAPDLGIARQAIGWAVAIGFSYAVLVELRQCLLPYRECSLADLAADWAGIAALAIYARNKGCLRARRLQERRLVGRTVAS